MESSSQFLSLVSLYMYLLPFLILFPMFCIAEAVMDVFIFLSSLLPWV